jgi:hypothetical protein
MWSNCRLPIRNDRTNEFNYRRLVATSTVCPAAGRLLRCCVVRCAGLGHLAFFTDMCRPRARSLFVRGGCQLWSVLPIQHDPGDHQCRSLSKRDPRCHCLSSVRKNTHYCGKAKLERLKRLSLYEVASTGAKQSSRGRGLPGTRTVSRPRGAGSQFIRSVYLIATTRPTLVDSFHIQNTDGPMGTLN